VAPIDLTNKTRVLIFHIGHLGDTLMILPALQAVRAFFKNAEYTLLSDKFIGAKRVIAHTVFENSKYFDQYIFFPKSKKGKKIFQAMSLLAVLPQLKLQKFDSLAYLTPSNRSVQQIERDRKIFNLAGIKHIIGMDGYYQLQNDPSNLPTHEADLLLARLAQDGLDVPAAGHAEFDLKLGAPENAKVEAFFAAHKIARNEKIMVAFGPGSKMQSKRWAAANFSKVGQKLIKKHDIFPIVFGGPEDFELGQMLIKSWRHGANAAGALGVREAAEALSRCAFYIGNDTGTMHLAAAVRTRCAAIFSARDIEGKWHPYGKGHLVFREHIACQECMLEYCEHKSCLARISPLTVFRRIEKEFADLLAA
jgi:ADP-heptose:LPS heptosyltransferase